MHLFEDKELFSDIIERTAEKLDIASAIIEKDYYVTLLLKQIVEDIPGIVFKGGTSLSKCYKLIERFSEDIDLSYDGVGGKPTESERRNLAKEIVFSAKKLGFIHTNEPEIKSRRDFNRFIFTFKSNKMIDSVKSHLLVETSVAVKSFPTEVLFANSFIHRYLLDAGYEDIIKQYDLNPYPVRVQTKERTFIDKVFAICDYFLADNIREHSRHIYDLYKLYPGIVFDEKLLRLIQEVRLSRKTNKMCISAQEGIDISGVINEMVLKESYKHDYNSITKDLLFEKLDYREAIQVLAKIAEHEIF